MYAPSIHVHALELGGDAGVEYAVLHICGYARAVIEQKDAALRIGLSEGEVDRASPGIASVPQRLDDDVLDVLDIVLGLPALGLGHAEANVPLTEVLLDAEIRFPGHGGDE